MPKVSSVEPQKKNPKRFNIFLDGQFAFGADQDLVVDHRLVVGKILDASDVEKLLSEAEIGKLMERMYGLFNIRQRSEEEVRRYLRNLSFKRKIKDKEEISDTVTESLVNRLKQKRLLNDEQFAKSWVEARSKKKGKIALKAELIQKGINREIIDEVMSGGVTNERQGQVAEKLLNKKMARWKNLLPLEFRKKAYEFLLRRGFEYEVVREIVENLTKK